MAEEADQELMELAGLAETQERSSLVIKFSVEPQENEQASRKAGRPIFDDVEVIEIRVPGDPDIRRSNVTPDHKRLYPKQYLAFKKGNAQEAVSGTPLSVWPPMKRSQVEEARHFGVHTVQQLAQISDGNLQHLGPGWISLRQLARDWEKQANDGAALGQLRAALDEATARIKTMEDMLQKQALELHRDPKAPFEASPPADDRVARLEALVASLAAQQVPRSEVEPVPVNGAKKPDGRSKEARAAKAAAKAAQS